MLVLAAPRTRAAAVGTLIAMIVLCRLPFCHVTLVFLLQDPAPYSMQLAEPWHEPGVNDGLRAPVDPATFTHPHTVSCVIGVGW